MANREDTLSESVKMRAQAWSKWGQVDDDVITHLMSPTLRGGPRWPAMRQAFRVVRRKGAVLVASDGLSDPFDPGKGEPGVNGFGLEFYAISSDPLEEVPGSWLFDMVWEISQLAARRGDIAELVDELGLVSTELYNVGIPEEVRNIFVNDEDRVGVLLGVSDEVLPKSVQGPLSDIRLVGLKLLTLLELEYCIENGEEGRQELARRVGLGPAPAASSLSRGSVISMAE